MRRPFCWGGCLRGSSVVSLSEAGHWEALVGKGTERLTQRRRDAETQSARRGRNVECRVPNVQVRKLLADIRCLKPYGGKQDPRMGEERNGPHELGAATNGERNGEGPTDVTRDHG